MRQYESFEIRHCIEYPHNTKYSYRRVSITFHKTNKHR